MSDTPRTDQTHRVAMSLVVGDDYSGAHDEMMQFARELERELNAMTICAGDLRDALATLVRIEEADYAPWYIEPGSELGLALDAAKKALTTWASKEG